MKIGICSWLLIFTFITMLQAEIRTGNNVGKQLLRRSKPNGVYNVPVILSTHGKILRVSCLRFCGRIGQEEKNPITCLRERYRGICKICKVNFHCQLSGFKLVKRAY